MSDQYELYGGRWYDFFDGEDEPDECAIHHEPLDVCGQCSTCRINESLYRDVVASREDEGNG